MWRQMAYTVGKRRGGASMHPDLEADFRNQPTLLLRLIAERRQLPDGGRAAEEIDRLIAKVKELVRSYQTVKWYEGEA
jgi:hypothetical protein